MLAFLGYALIGAGPPAALFVEFVAKRPFLVLLTLASAFACVTVMLLTSLVCKPLAFLLPGAAEYVVPMFAILAVEEGLRFKCWQAGNKLLAKIDKLAADMRHPRVRLVERVSFQLSLGMGQAIAHSIAFFLSTLPLSYTDATYYSPKCSAMPYFLVASLSSSSFFVTLTLAMVVADIHFSHAVRGGKARRALVPAGIHAAAALATLLSEAHNGCVAAAAANVAIAAGVSCYTCWLVWRLPEGTYGTVRGALEGDES